MNQNLESKPVATTPQNNDPTQPFSLTQALMERSVLACNAIYQFGTKLLSDEEVSPDEHRRFKMLPTEMIVAMYNLRVGIEKGLLTLAAMGLPAELRDKAQDVFIEKAEGESTDLERLFENIVEKGGPEGFVAVTDITIPVEIGIESDEYLGSLDFLKEMAAKYQRYAFENVPEVMEGACNLRDKQPSGLPKPMNDGEKTCSQLQNPQSANNSGINPEEVIKFQKMSEELIDDANVLFGQFCAVGSIYSTALKH